MDENEKVDLIETMGGIQVARTMVTGKATQDIYFDPKSKLFFQPTDDEEWTYWDTKGQTWLKCDPVYEGDLIDHMQLWVAICKYTKSMKLGSKVVAFTPIDNKIRIITHIYHETGMAMLDGYYLIPLDQIRHPTTEELYLGKKI